MAGKIQTQESNAVKALIEFITRKPCKEMPAAFPLANGAQLTMSNKGDVYYMTLPNDCSCPARLYHPNQSCKHMKALLVRNGREASRAQARAYQARQRELRAKAKASSMREVESILPKAKWPVDIMGRYLRRPEN